VLSKVSCAIVGQDKQAKKRQADSAAVLSSERVQITGSYYVGNKIGKYWASVTCSPHVRRAQDTSAQGNLSPQRQGPREPCARTPLRLPRHLISGHARSTTPALTAVAALTLATDLRQLLVT
jgi:hypothetical protein